jgi:hypothetical protein
MTNFITWKSFFFPAATPGLPTKGNDYMKPLYTA